MSKVTPVGEVPGTGMHWEKFEYEAYVDQDAHQLEVVADYLLVRHTGYRRKVLVNLSMEELVALRASIDTLIASETERGGEPSHGSEK